ncbi:MAG: hypothetical protein F6K50_02815 [Moorea sp. SIO3I7]|nr:hypothetical protein [Moorena sp. SIO3I7]
MKEMGCFKAEGRRQMIPELGRCVSEVMDRSRVGILPAKQDIERARCPFYRCDPRAIYSPIGKRTYS